MKRSVRVFDRLGVDVHLPGAVPYLETVEWLIGPLAEDSASLVRSAISSGPASRNSTAAMCPFA